MSRKYSTDLSELRDEVLTELKQIRTWRERRDAVIEEYLQRAGGDVTVAIELIDSATKNLPRPSDGADLLTLLEAIEQLQAKKE